MNSWKCYILKAVDNSNRTYVGATPDVLRRLDDHNGINKNRGARATRGRWWEVAIIVTGFETKRACLAFESAVRRIRRYKKRRLHTPSTHKSPISKRVVDLFNVIDRGHRVHAWTSLKLHFIEMNAAHYAHLLENTHNMELSDIERNTGVTWVFDIDHL